jgi:hypothetical protein
MMAREFRSVQRTVPLPTPHRSERNGSQPQALYYGGATPSPSTIELEWCPHPPSRGQWRAPARAAASQAMYSQLVDKVHGQRIVTKDGKPLRDVCYMHLSNALPIDPRDFDNARTSDATASIATAVRTGRAGATPGCGSSAPGAPGCTTTGQPTPRRTTSSSRLPRMPRTLH